MSADELQTVIAGSGPAGVSAAAELLAAGGRVTLIAGLEGDPDSYVGAAPRGVWEHEALPENRATGVGGTSSRWGGRCVLLDPIDFEYRDWVPNSGWPITYHEYLEWLAPAAHLLQIGTGSFSTPEPTGLLAGDRDVRPEDFGLRSDSTERWSLPVHFGDVLRDLEAKYPRLTVLRNSAVTAIRIREGRVEGFQVRTPEGTVYLQGSDYILAAGAIESVRLLLASGLGERLPALGRYYMSHVFVTAMRLSGDALPAESGFHREAGVFTRNRWILSAEEQRRLGVGNSVGFVVRAPADEVAIHRDSTTSAVEIAKGLRAVLRSARPLEEFRTRRTALRQHLSVVRSAGPRFWGSMAASIAARSARRRLPMVLPALQAPWQYLFFQGEHLPHRDSVIGLSAEFDSDGVPRAFVAPEFERQDFDTALAFHEALSSFARARGYRVEPSAEEATRRLVRGIYRSFNSGAHQIGGARMGVDAASSVTDSDARVHGVQNLFVAGASIFPTSGHANPTLSIVMLSIRLGSFLASRSGSPDSSS